ncbi:hypothetical protein OPQ81_009155 [Rhizoctonia solani]|nr:hypothetical protein OPQ81_009155 [Rhizoctonia solani]
MRAATCQCSPLESEYNLPLSSPIETPAESSRAESLETIDNSTPIEDIIEYSYPIPNFRDHLRGDPYNSPPQQPKLQQLLTLPTARNNRVSHDGHHTGAIMSSGRVNCLESLFSLAWPSDQPNRISRTSQSPRFISIEGPQGPQLEVEDLEDAEDPENVYSEIVGFLWLDRCVESNSLPYILQAYATWISHFLFEPVRIVHPARHDVFKYYTMGEDSHYDPGNSPSFSMTEVIIRRTLIEAGTQVHTSRERDMRYALGSMRFTYEFISSLCKVGSLSSVIGIMQLAAPVFRRACPDSLERLVNLPTLLGTTITPLQYYATLDVLLGVLTGRPMFFRYEVKFTPDAPESLFSLEDGPGLRWTYGVPDRLILTFAQMNALFEDFGSHVSQEVVDSLEAHIGNMKPILAPSTEPLLSVARMVVQQCWFLAALIYLYMVLCGADSTDERVAKVRANFMKILVSVKPKRNPDAFLVFPLIILGVATNNPNQQDIIRRRMLGVSECSRRGTMGNDFVRILDHIWSMRRPVVWSDLRQACWEVSGV